MTLLQRLDGGYTLENFDGIGRVIKTNSPSNTAFRGFGGPEGAFFIETIMDRISYELDLSPLKGKYLILTGFGRCFLEKLSFSFLNCLSNEDHSTLHESRNVQLT